MTEGSASSTRPAPSDGVAMGQAADQSERPQVSILIVAYNSAALIGPCLNSIIAACARTPFEVLLVDNGDGSTEQLVSDAFPRVRIVPSLGNVGFAAGNNLLADNARADLLLLLNPDMVLMPGGIDALMDGVQAHPEAGAWGGVTVYPDGRPDPGNAIAMPSLIEMASVATGRSRIGRQPIQGVTEDAPVDVLIGGFVMFSRKAWQEAGGLDDRFFLYCEEVDLFYRLAGKGYRFWRIAKARAHHAIAHGDNFSPLRLLYRAAGTMEFVKRHWSPPARMLAFLLTWLGAFIRYAAGRILGRARPNLAKMSGGYHRVALEPGLWMHGYDPQRGLLAKLAKAKPPKANN